MGCSVAVGRPSFAVTAVHGCTVPECTGGRRRTPLPHTVQVRRNQISFHHTQGAGREIMKGAMLASRHDGPAPLRAARSKAGPTCRKIFRRGGRIGASCVHTCRSRGVFRHREMSESPRCRYWWMCVSTCLRFFRGGLQGQGRRWGPIPGLDTYVSAKSTCVLNVPYDALADVDQDERRHLLFGFLRSLLNFLIHRCAKPDTTDRMLCG